MSIALDPRGSQTPSLNCEDREIGSANKRSRCEASAKLLKSTERLSLRGYPCRNLHELRTSSRCKTIARRLPSYIREEFRWICHFLLIKNLITGHHDEANLRPSCLHGIGFCLRTSCQHSRYVNRMIDTEWANDLDDITGIVNDGRRPWHGSSPP